MSAYDPTHPTCVSCNYRAEAARAENVGAVRGNTARFLTHSFHLWKCPKCHTIHSLDTVDYADIYRDYPPNQRQLDVFAKGTLGNLLRRLERAGLRKEDAILDYGCGNGLFIRFLEQRGYRKVSGFDPYVVEYAHAPEGFFDCVVANDVIEHVDDPRAMVAACAGLVRPGGLLYIGTADAEPVDMNNLEAHLMCLHQPFHRVILSETGLHRLAGETAMDLVASWRRSYMDTLMPFANYRFLDQFNKALGHNMDRAMHPAAGEILLRRPDLLFYALFGYFLPCAWEPAVLLRKPTNREV